MSDAVEAVWNEVLDLADRGVPVRLKSGKTRSFARAGSTSVTVVEVTAPNISKAQIARALQLHPLDEWPNRAVSEVEDIGNTAYVWALLRHVALGGQPQPDDGPLGEVRLRAAEVSRAEDALHEAIREAAAGDFSLRQIGDAAGMSHQTIARIAAG